MRPTYFCSRTLLTTDRCPFGDFVAVRFFPRLRPVAYTSKSHSHIALDLLVQVLRFTSSIQNALDKASMFFDGIGFLEGFAKLTSFLFECTKGKIREHIATVVGRIDTTSLLFRNPKGFGLVEELVSAGILDTPCCSVASIFKAYEPLPPDLEEARSNRHFSRDTPSACNRSCFWPLCRPWCRLKTIV